MVKRMSALDTVLGRLENIKQVGKGSGQAALSRLTAKDAVTVIQALA